MNLSLLARRAPACLFHSLFFLILLATSSSARASGETIARVDASGNVNPCAAVVFQLTNFTPPTGYILSSVDWYANGIFQQTVNNGIYCTLTVKYNNGAWTYPVYCVVHYNNGASATSNTVTLTVNLMDLKAITASGPAVENCTSAINYTTSFDNSGLTYVPSTANISSYTWNLPSGWTTNSVTNGNIGNSGNNPYSTATVTPNASTAGNVSAAVTLTCGYSVTSPVLAVSRITPATGTPTVTPVVCAGGSASASITPICGPTSYTYSVPSGSGVTFTSNNSPSLTTTASSVNLSVSSSASSGDVPVSVVANYPTGSSGAVSYNMHVGQPTTPANISGTQGAQYCPGTYFDVYAQPNSNDATSWLWGVSFTYSSANGLAGGQGQQMATISLPGGYTYSYQGQEVDEFLIDLQGVNTCGTSSWVATMAGTIVSCDGGGGGGTGTIAGRRTDSAFANGFATKNTLSVYPNPAASAVYIALPDSVNLATATITLSDIHGRQLKKLATLSSVNRIPLSGLASGIYFVEIFDGKKILSVQKVVKK